MSMQHWYNRHEPKVPFKFLQPSQQCLFLVPGPESYAQTHVAFNCYISLGSCNLKQSLRFSLLLKSLEGGWTFYFIGPVSTGYFLLAKHKPCILSRNIIQTRLCYSQCITSTSNAVNLNHPGKLVSSSFCQWQFMMFLLNLIIVLRESVLILCQYSVPYEISTNMI